MLRAIYWIAARGRHCVLYIIITFALFIDIAIASGISIESLTLINRNVDVCRWNISMVPCTMCLFLANIFNVLHKYPRCWIFYLLSIDIETRNNLMSQLNNRAIWPEQDLNLSFFLHKVNILTVIEQRQT